MRTQVGIVGAGPAGLMLSHLLHLEGIESIILENRSRDYIASRIRAGLMEQWARDLLIETGVGERMQREGLSHNGIHFCFDSALHYIDFRKLVGQGVTIYGQQEVVKDLVSKARHQKSGFTIKARQNRSTAISSAAAMVFMASVGRAFLQACSPSTTANIRSAGSAFCRSRRRPTMN
jgi:p-hydroxybenzoate 3-monooxygenase